MSDKKKRGVSKCKKKLLHPGKCKVDFDEEGNPTGPNAGGFMSWIGVEFKKRIPYNKVATDINPKEFEGIWEYAKETWKILDDCGKKVTLSKGKTIMRNFRYNLRRTYINKADSLGKDVNKDESPGEDVNRDESPDEDVNRDESLDKDNNDESPNKDKGKDPFEDYDYLNKQLWKSFVAVGNDEKWKEKSKKAKNSAKQNIDPARVGRCGLSGLKPYVESRWKQLVSSYPYLEAIQHPDSKMFTVSKARFNPITKLYELGEGLISKDGLKGTLKKMYLEEKQLMDDGSYPTKDGVTEVTKKGRCKRLLSDVNGPANFLSSKRKSKKNKRKVVETIVEESPGICGSSSVFDSSYTKLPEILSIKKCELLCLDGEGVPTVIAMGRVHPTTFEGTTHGCPMTNGFVKVQVDRTVEGCGSTRLLPESCIPGELEYLEDAKGSFIQWPFKAIKILNKDPLQTVEPSHHTMSTCYSPQFEAPSAHQQRIPGERNEYHIYSNALQDEDAFNQLLVDKQFSQTTTEHVPFYEPTESAAVNQNTEPIYAYQPTNPVNVNQATKTVHANQPIELVRDCQPTKPLVTSNLSKEKIEVSKGNTKISKLLEKARSRPQRIYGLAQQVAIQSEKALSMVYTSPTGMYEECIEETIYFEAVVQLCVNGKAEPCFVHWFTMYLYVTGEKKGLNNAAYFHPRYIEGDLVSDDGDFVIDHIKNVISFHKDRQWFMAPHLVGRHWVLILLQHHPIYKTWKGHIFDSLKGTKESSDYEITNLFEKATEQKITWDMVNCRQQPQRWECGYCVMMAMYDFVICNRQHMLGDKTKMVRQGEIDEFIELTLKVFISSFGALKNVEDE